MATSTSSVLTDQERHLVAQALETYSGVVARRVNAEKNPQILEILKAQAREVEAVRLKV